MTDFIKPEVIMLNIKKSTFAVGILLLIVAICIGCSDDDKGTDPNNHNPAIESITADADTVYTDSLITVTVLASDPDGDALQYTWESDKLDYLSSSGNVAYFEACGCSITQPTNCTIACTIKDGRGGQASASTSVHVKPRP